MNFWPIPNTKIWFVFQVLKKAQRDASHSRKEIVEHFKQTLKSEVDEVFRKFRASFLEAGDEEGLEVRKHYLKLRPEVAIAEIFEKFHLLMTFFKPTSKPEKRRHQRIGWAIQVRSTPQPLYNTIVWVHSINSVC